MLKWMDPNELWAETAELADLIAKSAEVVSFQAAELEMKAHPEAARLIQELRETQEQITDFQVRRVPPKHYVHLLEQSESLLEQLGNISAVVQFQNAQMAVNDLLQQVSTHLAEAVFKDINNGLNE
jgi:cell fate (sporulation/competence/biofilm development) regulator YmcA (YheA/YmcA/DUF963 family)